MKKLVAIGGGTGLATLLRSIRDYPIEIAAVVTMTDDGKSTGRLRKEFDLLPPGDIRKCIAALSDNEDILLDLWQYRFNKGVGLKGHSLGNLIISAAKDLYDGNFELAIEGMCELFSTKGRVLPSTLKDVQLSAIFDDGKEIRGESKLRKYGYKHQIEEVKIGGKIEANPKVLSAIEGADYIFIGPGSLFTSIIPNFLLEEVTESFNTSKAQKIYICNASTERGETEGFTVSDHVEALGKYNIFVDLVLINNRKFKKGSGDGFVMPVSIGQGTKSKYNIRESNLVNNVNPLYHDVEKLGKEIWQIIIKR
ncbi:MAG: gluconeogenesis factor YvcK family protein [bacterium]